MDNWIKLQMNKMTDKLKAEIRKENMELKVLFNSFKVEELKAEITKGNMELRAMITDLINANVRSESSGQTNTQRTYTTSDEEEDSQYMHYQGNTEDDQSVKNDSEQDSSDHSDIHEEEAKNDTIEIDDVEIEKEQNLTDGAEMEMLFTEPMYLTPLKHTIYSRDNSPPKPILPAKGKPKNILNPFIRCVRAFGFAT
ncbi:uncharacterized protein LOC134702065 [Mytilus trossulus]|uniref:uncharacterized protein LOC134702065 n=1 Tax=Mytilus trossulus TaxID=6551 RepID=UPI003005A7EC